MLEALYSQRIFRPWQVTTADDSLANFEKKGIVTIETKSKLSEEEVMEIAIEAGADDVEKEEGNQFKVLIKFILHLKMNKPTHKFCCVP